MLDPSLDDIKAYLRLNLQTGEYEEIDGNSRAATTIKDTGLNRERLVRARQRIIICVIKDFRAHLRCGDAQTFLTELKELKEDISFPGLYDDLITHLSASKPGRGIF